MNKQFFSLLCLLSLAPVVVKGSSNGTDVRPALTQEESARRLQEIQTRRQELLAKKAQFEAMEKALVDQQTVDFELADAKARAQEQAVAEKIKQHHEALCAQKQSFDKQVQQVAEANRQKKAEELIHAQVEKEAALIKAHEEAQKAKMQREQELCAQKSLYDTKLQAIADQKRQNEAELRAAQEAARVVQEELNRAEIQRQADLVTEEAARVEAQRQADVKAQEEATRVAQEELNRAEIQHQADLATEEARLAQEMAEEAARVEAQRQADVKAQEEATRVAQEELNRAEIQHQADLATEEARLAQEKAEEAARVEAQRQADIKAQEEAAAVAKEAELKAREEARLAQEKAEEAARVEAQRQADLRAQEEARLAKIEADRKAKAAQDALLLEEQTIAYQLADAKAKGLKAEAAYQEEVEQAAADLARYTAAKQQAEAQLNLAKTSAFTAAQHVQKNAATTEKLSADLSNAQAAVQTAQAEFDDIASSYDTDVLTSGDFRRAERELTQAQELELQLKTQLEEAEATQKALAQQAEAALEEAKKQDQTLQEFLKNPAPRIPVRKTVAEEIELVATKASVLEVPVQSTTTVQQQITTPTIQSDEVQSINGDNRVTQEASVTSDSNEAAANAPDQNTSEEKTNDDSEVDGKQLVGGAAVAAALGNQTPSAVGTETVVASSWTQHAQDYVYNNQAKFATTLGFGLLGAGIGGGIAHGLLAENATYRKTKVGISALVGGLVSAAGTHFTFDKFSPVVTPYLTVPVLGGTVIVGAIGVAAYKACTAK